MLVNLYICKNEIEQDYMSNPIACKRLQTENLCMRLSLVSDAGLMVTSQLLSAVHQE